MERVSPRLLFALLVIGISLAIIFFVFPSLPEIIPTHFDIHGNPDGFNSKGQVGLGLTIVMVVLCLLIAGAYYIVSNPDRYKRMQRYNYPNMNVLSPEAQEQVRLISIKITDFCFFLLMLLFLDIQIEMCLIALGKMTKLSPLIWLFLAAIFIPTLYYTGLIIRLRFFTPEARAEKANEK